MISEKTKKQRKPEEAAKNPDSESKEKSVDKSRILGFIKKCLKRELAHSEILDYLKIMSSMVEDYLGSEKASAQGNPELDM